MRNTTHVRFLNRPARSGRLERTSHSNRPPSATHYQHAQQPTIAEGFVQALLVEQRGAATVLRNEDATVTDMYIHVAAKKVEGVGTEWTLALSLEAPYMTRGMHLEVELEKFFDSEDGDHQHPAWVSQVRGVQTRPLHIVCSVVWLLHYARAMVERENAPHPSALVPWWRIIRFTTYVLRTSVTAEALSCPACGSRLPVAADPRPPTERSRMEEDRMEEDRMEEDRMGEDEVEEDEMGEDGLVSVEKVAVDLEKMQIN